MESRLKIHSNAKYKAIKNVCTFKGCQETGRSAAIVPQGGIR